MTHPVTDETPDVGTGVDETVDELVYQVEVLVEVRLPAPGPDDDEDAEFDKAHALVDETLQRAWDTDQGRGFGIRVHPWHYEMFEDSVKVVDQRPAGD